MRRFRLRPNRNALGLAAILIAMWYAAASQNNSAVYLLGFVLASLATVSIVHAWVNVYGVALSAEPIAPVFLGEDIGIPLVGTARRRRRHGHPGLRVTSATCHQAAPFDEIRFESPQRSLLWMRAEERGRFETVEVELSTIYPMGFITAIRPDQLVQLHFVYPKPDGNLPLPQSQSPSKHLPDGVRSDGDDFSGTRAYRQGESQRHIDWKAAARGQPLLVKQWAGDTDDVIRLDWHTLGALSWEARLSQLTRWVIQAEQSGATYSLTLPRLTESSTDSSGSSMIRPDHGPAHFHECLRALAAFPPSLTERAEPLPPRSEPVPLPRADDLRNPHSVVRTDSLAAICLGLLLGAIPLLDRMPPVATAMFFAALITRLWINVKGSRLPSMPIKLVLLGGGLGLIGLIYGTMVGIEPGLGILFVLLSLKLLETNTIHDFQVLAMLGWFVALCGLFFSQDLRSWLYVGTVGLILTAALIRFHRGPGSAGNPLKKGGRFKGARGFGNSVKLTGTMLLQGSPLILLLFLFFPRTYGGYQFTFSNGITNQRAMSEKMEPGSVATLALSDRPVFRVEFPDQNMPSTSQMYWRGGVLWRGDGLTWLRGGLRLEADSIPLTGPAIRQQIVMEPHGGRWIFALDRPMNEVSKTTQEAGGYLQSIKPVNKSLRYSVVSRPENRETKLFPEHLVAALQKPSNVSPRIQALVASWVKGSTKEQGVVESALKFFQTENFSYTLTPGRYSGDALDQFLFVRRSGFCEHYAGAFASLMRIAGIPARVVIGFHGGEFNALGGYVIVRQCDAHAWCEVWLNGRGWARVDPVDAIAPGRIQSGLTSFLESRSRDDDSQSRTDSTSFTGRFLSRLRLAWDSLNYQWDLRVLSFDEESQRSLVSFLGFGEPSWISPLPWLAMTAGVCFIILSLRIRRPWPQEDVAVREYSRFCKKLAASGLPRPAFEGASDFTERAACHFPAQAVLIRRIGALYVQLRYARSAPALADFLTEIKAFQKEKL